MAEGLYRSCSISVHMVRSSQGQLFDTKTQGKGQSKKSIPKRFSYNASPLACKKEQTREITSLPQTQHLNESRDASLRSGSSAWSCSMSSTCEAASTPLGSGSKTTLRPLWASFAPCCFHRYVADPVDVLPVSFAVLEEENNSFLAIFSPPMYPRDLCLGWEKSQRFLEHPWQN